MIKCLHFDRIFDLHHRKVWKRLQKVYFSRLNLNRVTMTLPNFQKKPETTSRNRWVPVRKFISHIWTILTKFPTLLCFPFFFENLSFLPNHDFLLRVLSFVWKIQNQLSLLSHHCHTVDLASVGGVKFLFDFKRTLHITNANRKCQVGSKLLNFSLKSDKIQEPDIQAGGSGGPQCQNGWSKVWRCTCITNAIDAIFKRTKWTVISITSIEKFKTLIILIIRFEWDPQGAMWTSIGSQFDDD